MFFSLKEFKYGLKLLIYGIILINPPSLMSQLHIENLPKLTKIIVPFEPGASNDIFARLIAQKLALRSGSAVIVENKPGATGSIGAAYVSKAIPDGSVLLSTSTPYTSNAATQTKLSFDPVKGLSPVAMLGTGAQMLAVSSSSTFKTTAELINFAKSNKTKLNYASSGIGSSHHLTTARFNNVAGIETTHVPFKGGGPAILSLIGGDVHFMIFAPSTLMPHIKSGKIKVLALTSANRSKLFPGIPTISETIPDFTVESWWGIFAPPSTPQSTINRLNSEFRALVNLPEVKAAFEKEGVEASNISSLEFTNFILSDIENWRDVVRKLNIPINSD